jgi:hypothetical protein
MTAVPRLRLLFVLLVLSVAASGCAVVTFEQPLVDPAQAAPVPELYGVYRLEEEKTVTYLHIGPAGSGEIEPEQPESGSLPPGFVRIVAVGLTEETEGVLDYHAFTGFIEPIGGHYLFHQPLPRDKDEQAHKRQFAWEQGWDEEQVRGYWIARFTVTPEGLELAPWPNAKFLKEQVEAGNLTGKLEERRSKWVEVTDVTVTAEREELRRFFVQHIDGPLFKRDSEELIRLKRVERYPAPRNSPD